VYTENTEFAKIPSRLNSDLNQINILSAFTNFFPYYLKRIKINSTINQSLEIIHFLEKRFERRSSIIYDEK
jgi:hypothetical protein